jgi:hypothetical protein
VPPAFRIAAKILLLAVAVDALFLAFGLISLYRGNAYRLYQPSRLSAEIDANLDVERAGSLTGWPKRDTFPARASPLDLPQCGTSWGGSFTWSDDVEDTETWSHVLSARLGCQIANHGVDGFGLDQSFLHYREFPGRERLVIIGLAEPMIFVDAITSLTFLSLTDDKRPKPALTKPILRLDQDALRMIARPPANVTAIEQHYGIDRSSQDWTALRFPFSLHIGRAIYRKFSRTPFGDVSLQSTDPETVELKRLAARLIREMGRTAHDRGQHLVLLFIPRPGDLRSPNPILQTIVTDLGSEADAVCVVDPADELKRFTTGPMETGTGHYNATGNAALASAAERGLRNCGLLP